MCTSWTIIYLNRDVWNNNRPRDSRDQRSLARWKNAQEERTSGQKRERKRPNSGERTEEGLDLSKPPIVSTHAKRGLLSLDSRCLWEKYGWGEPLWRRDHFTLTEWFETGELGKVGGKPLEIRFHFRSSRNCCTTIRKLNRPPLEHLSKTLEKYGAESTR